MPQNATAATEENGQTTAYNGSQGRFVNGNPGRPKGTPDRRSQAKSELLAFIEAGDPALNLPPRRERIAALLTCGDPQVQVTAERFWWEQEFGKAKETKDITIHGAVVEDAKDHMGGKIWGQLVAVPDEDPPLLEQAI